MKNNDASEKEKAQSIELKKMKKKTDMILKEMLSKSHLKNNTKKNGSL